MTPRPLFAAGSLALLVLLPFGPGNDQRPDVSADGSRILFNRNLDNSIEIYELVLDSTKCCTRTDSPTPGPRRRP